MKLNSSTEEYLLASVSAVVAVQAVAADDAPRRQRAEPRQELRNPHRPNFFAILRFPPEAHDTSPEGYRGHGEAVAIPDAC